MKEKELFEYLISCCYPDLVMARSKMSRWDCYSPKTYHRIELKCRATHYDELIIEKKKYDAMIENCNDNLDIPFYINSTPLGIYRWNLYLVKPVWKTKYLRKTTEFSNSNRIPKEIAMLNVKDAEIL